MDAIAAYDVMVAGHVCLDITPRIPDTGARRVEDLLRPGKLCQTGAAVVSTGGAVSNTGIAMRKRGNSVFFSARVGDDELGKLTLDCLARNGDVSGVRIEEKGTSSYTVVLALPGVDRMFLHNPGPNDRYGEEDLGRELVGQCRLFHFGYPSIMARMYSGDGSELLRVFRKAKDGGAITSCDMALPDPDSPSGNAPWRAILAKALPSIDIFAPSIEEALYMLHRDEFLRLKRQHEGADLIGLLGTDVYSYVATELLAMGPSVVLLKAGHKGLYLRTGEHADLMRTRRLQPSGVESWACRELWSASFQAPHMATATGAGDAAIAGFLTALLKGAGTENALLCANCLGWQNVQAYDAVSGIRTWEETEQLVESGMAVTAFEPSNGSWRRLATDGLWAGPADRPTQTGPSMANIS